RGILHIGSLLAEDRTQQLLFRCQLGFALGRDLTDQNIARTNFRSNVDHTGLVEFRQSAFADIGNIRGNFFRPQLGVTRHTGQFLNMDRGEAIVLNHTLGDQNRVFEVVAVPGHEGDTHVLTESQLTHIDRRAVRHDVATRDQFALFDQRALVDTGVLVGAGVLGQVVDINTGITGLGLFVIHAHYDTRSVDGLDHTTATRHHAHTGVLCHITLDTGTYQRLFSAQRRYGLTLHVRTHQGAVSVVVLEEGNQGRSHRHNLAWRHIHEVHPLGRHHSKFVLVANRYQFFRQTTTLVHRSTGLGHYIFAFLDGRQVFDVVSHQTIDYAAVWAFQEAVGVGPGVSCQGVDQTNVRTFRRLNRTYTTVMGRMHVPHLKACTLTGQTARAQC